MTSCTSSCTSDKTYFQDQSCSTSTVRAGAGRTFERLQQLCAGCPKLFCNCSLRNCRQVKTHLACITLRGPPATSSRLNSVAPLAPLPLQLRRQISRSEHLCPVLPLIVYLRFAHPIQFPSSKHKRHTSASGIFRCCYLMLARLQLKLTFVPHSIKMHACRTQTSYGVSI